MDYSKLLFKKNLALVSTDMMQAEVNLTMLEGTSTFDYIYFFSTMIFLSRINK